MIAKTFILAAALAATTATAAPILTFEGVANGASVADFYNGGTDSMGNKGYDYGIRFDGGTVRYNQFGAYLEGRSMMTFAGGALGTGVSYMADGYFLDSMTWTYRGAERFEPWMIESMSYQPPMPGVTTPTVPGHYQGKVWPGVIWLDGAITGIGWNTWALDDILLDSRSLPSFTKCYADDCNPGSIFPEGGVATGEVPEPGALALLLAGMLAWNGRRLGSLVSRRRRHESDPKHSYRCSNVLSGATFQHQYCQ